MNKLILLLSFLFIFNNLNGDSWFLESEEKNTIYKFDDVQVILNYNTLESNSWPRYSTYIFVNDSLVGNLLGFGFENLYASPSNKYFLGVSNNGLTKFAFIIFDRKGNIIKAIRHSNNNLIVNGTVTLIKEWYYAKNPEVEFIEENGLLKDITINKRQRIFLKDKDGNRLRDKNTRRYKSEIIITRLSLMKIKEGKAEHKNINQVYKYSNVKIIVNKKYIYDYRPKYTLCIFNSDSLVGVYNDLGFEELYVSPDTTYFLGVSNTPTTNFSYVIFSNKGKIIKTERFHSFKEYAEDYKYDRKYLTWYNRKNPGVVFEIENNELVNVKINTKLGSRPDANGNINWLKKSLIKK